MASYSTGQPVVVVLGSVHRVAQYGAGCYATVAVTGPFDCHGLACDRKQWREHSRNYLQALLVQAQERRNAENLSESVGVSARAMQRFLTEARWSDGAVIGRLQEYLAPSLGHSEAVWVLDGSDFPNREIWGRARYSGTKPPRGR